MSLHLIHVDDDPDDLLLVKAMLQEAMGDEVEIDSFLDPKEALAALESSTYHACLLDFYLGRDTAMDLMEPLRAAAPRLPVVVLTNADEGATAAEALRGGAVDFLPKNQLTANMLLQAIERAVAAGDADQAASRQKVAQASKTEALEEFLARAPIGLVAVDAFGNPVYENDEARRWWGEEPPSAHLSIPLEPCEWRDGVTMTTHNGEAMRCAVAISPWSGGNIVAFHPGAHRPQRPQPVVHAAPAGYDDADKLAALVSHEVRGLVRRIGFESSGRAPQLKSMLDDLDLMLADLVDYARLRVRHQARWIAPGEILESAVNMHNAGGSKFQAAFEGRDVPAVRGDPVQLRRAFSDILNVVERFCEDDDTVEATAGAQNDHACIRFSCPAFNLVEKQRTAMLKPFWHAGPKGVHRGAAVGLATVARIMKLHGGTCTLEVGQPGAIVLRIPAAPNPEETHD